MTESPVRMERVTGMPTFALRIRNIVLGLVRRVMSTGDA